MGRYWLGGPCEKRGREVWLVIDGDVTPGDPRPTSVFEGSEAACRAKIKELNK